MGGHGVVDSGLSAWQHEDCRFHPNYELEYARRLYDWCLHGNAEIGETTGIVLSETIREVIEHSEFLKNPHSAAQKIIEKSTVHVYAVDPQCNANETDDDDDDDDYDSSDDSFYSDTESCRKYPPFPSSHPCIPSRQFGTDNGALVQIAILGVPYFHHPDEVEANTSRICRTTHSHPLCVASCVVTTSLVSQMLQGRNSLSCHKSLEEILSCAITKATKYLDNSEQIEELNRYVNCSSIQNLTVGEQYNMSYVLKALGAAVLAVKSPLSYKSFMLNLFMEGGDSNSNGCVAGAILGCKVGYSKLPPEWLNGLRKQETEWLNLKINHLLDMIGLP
ncbi:hypothetical protein DPMN_017359 [Dreissena polymorpha]|uniref:ADP-ribosylglycohydrolase n=1 Tax=Dreissena polymorpha TaxID=45954 RepID=A0A9D4NF73_DREPO|nr:hypothetical protein DPMN_017359 [Dreissena polymorpha]